DDKSSGEDRSQGRERAFCRETKLARTGKTTGATVADLDAPVRRWQGTDARSGNRPGFHHGVERKSGLSREYGRLDWGDRSFLPRVGAGQVGPASGYRANSSGGCPAGRSTRAA